MDTHCSGAAHAAREDDLLHRLGAVVGREQVRADEACHRNVNHTLAALPAGALNPFKKGAHSSD